MFKVFLALWVIVAGYSMINPRHVWEITQGWKAHREPPKSYFVIARTTATIFFLVGFVFLFLELFA